jgi:hypothetical protein
MLSASCRRWLGKLACIQLCLITVSGCQNSASDQPSKVTSNSNSKSTPKDKTSQFAANGTSNIAAEQFDIPLDETLFRNGKEQGLFSLPETIGGGMAFLDFDRDGKLDFVTAGGGIPLPENERMQGYPGAMMRATGNQQFIHCSSAAQIDFSATYNQAIIVGDYDGDGFRDILVTGYCALQLFRNQGDGTFESVAQSAKLTDDQWSSSAAFLDVDSDGDLDLYVVHYADWSFQNNPICNSHYEVNKRDYCGPRDFKGLRDGIFENMGDGTFRDRTTDSGMLIASRGLGVIAADFDDDNRVDIYVANDVENNLLYHNRGEWRFDEMGVRSGVACDDQSRPEGSMGIAIGDYNLDGKFDLFVTNYQTEICALYRNESNLSFSYASRSTKLSPTDEQSVSWGTAFNDLDLDGDEDVIVINGHLESYSSGSPYEQMPQPLENIDGKFFRLSRNSVGKYFNTPQPGRGLAMGDVDGDGLVDFGVTRLNQPMALVRNTSKPQGRFLSIQAIGTASNRDAIGAKLTLQVGDRKWIRQIYGGGSYSSTSDLAVHFGVPSSVASLPARLSIRWPSGVEQMIPVELDQHLMVIEGQ